MRLWVLSPAPNKSKEIIQVIHTVPYAKSCSLPLMSKHHPLVPQKIRTDSLTSSIVFCKAGANDPHRKAQAKQPFPWKLLNWTLYRILPLSVWNWERHCCHLITSPPAVSLCIPLVIKKKCPGALRTYDKLNNAKASAKGWYSAWLFYRQSF